MELDSFVMAHSVALYTVESLRKEFPDKPIHLYTFSDSSTVLHWCKSENFSENLGVFVSNRLQAINEFRDGFDKIPNVRYHIPRHVRSQFNPADHATRGLTALEMSDPNHQWWVGPKWMQSDPSTWPNDTLPSTPPVFMSELVVVAEPVIETVIDLSRFSSLKLAVAVTARVYRFLSNVASRVKNRAIQQKLAHIPTSSDPLLNVSEKKFALQRIIRLHQMKHAGIGKSNHSHITEDPVTGVWVASTRLANSDLSPESKYPVYIPTSVDSKLARLLISDVHKSATHANFETVLNQIKSTYWIPRCRQIAKAVLKQCLQCRRTNGLPFKYPLSPALPPGRVHRSRPFEHTGIDYAGPFASIDGNKMYIVIFTCFSTRLSHLDIVDSLLPSSFIFALRRLCSRRGTPSRITSDQATTFKMSSSLLANPVADPDINTLISDLGIQWHFTTAHSPWKGGIYERLVKIIKDSLARSIGRRKLTHDEFETVASEIEALLNSRPLSYVASDDVQSFTGPVLRPIDLIMPNSFLGCPLNLLDDGDAYKPPEEENSSRETAVAQLKNSILIVDSFWKRWHQEYLTTLRDGSSKSDPLQSTRSSSINPSIGSIVLVIDESGNIPRSSWKMAKITSLTDTSATLRSHTGRIIERPINLLIPLEIHSNEEPEVVMTNVANETDVAHPMTTRSRAKQAASRQ